jgi:queuine tRNA-ribosyltransferase
MLKVKGKKINTPFFMPDATRAVIKQLSTAEAKKIGLEAMVVNTFHLYLQPGLEIIKKAGGVHQFMNWPGLLLSDSGGFQIYSLIHKGQGMGKITDDGAYFKSPLDGSKHFLSPEKSIQIQFDLGVDMMVCLDDCPPNESDKEGLEKAVKRTIMWAKRSKVEYNKQLKKRKIKDKDRPLLFAVIQGGLNLKLRAKCAQELVALNFDGYGFGARHIDSDGNFLNKVLTHTVGLIPKDKFRFALGIGTPEDIKKCVKMGWDMFDCVIPTREGRHGRLFVKAGKGYKTININNTKFKKDFSAINKNSHLSELTGYSKAYLYHLFKINEPLGQKLASLNNLEVYLDLMASLRK